jgi:hypothetical protein
MTNIQDISGISEDVFKDAPAGYIAAAGAEAGKPPIRNITQGATILQESGGVMLIQVEGKIYLFTPSETQGGTHAGGDDIDPENDIKPETVLLNGKRGVIEPVPDESWSGIGDPEERLGVLRIAQESGALSAADLEKLEINFTTPNANGTDFEKTIKQALTESFPNEAAKQQFAEYVKEHAYNMPPTSTNENLLKWANEWEAELSPTISSAMATTRELANGDTSVEKITGADVLAKFNITPITVNGVVKFQLDTSFAV